jgi:hypothetical protein
MLDFAEILKELVDDVYPDADKIVMVTDTLNIQHAACLYARHAPAEARRIAQQISVIHQKPTHHGTDQSKTSYCSTLDKITTIENSIILNLITRSY